MVYSNYAAEVAEHIRAAMGECSVSANQLSDRTGIPLSTISSRLAGAREFTMHDLAMIADALGVSRTSLMPTDFATDSYAHTADSLNPQGAVVAA